MSKGLIEVILLLSGVIVVAAAWLFLKRPLALLAWGTRRSLIATGLKKQVVQTPAGAQTVFVGGTGPVLVLLHGAGDHAGTWAQAAKALAKDHTLVIPDLAGHGDSAPATGPIDTAQIYAGIEATLTSQTPGQAVTLVGNSLGAWMAPGGGPAPSRLGGQGGGRERWSPFGCQHPGAPAPHQPGGGARHHGPAAGCQQPRHP